MRKILSLASIAIALTAGSCFAQFTGASVVLTTDNPKSSVTLQKGEMVMIDFSALQAAENANINLINTSFLRANETRYTTYRLSDSSVLQDLNVAVFEPNSGIVPTPLLFEANNIGSVTVNIICGSGNSSGMSIQPALTGKVEVTVQ